ncbi:MAG: hypothetical protein GY909_01420 [Oligoflexia bacterium]|nr:hypothetical protein [Oligoflexia bacterium]
MSPINAKKIIIFGSASNVSDRLDWHKDLAIEIDKRLQQGIPVMGICFGHQLMADFYDGEVDFNEPRKIYDGIREVEFLKDFGNIQAGTKLSFLKRHEQRVKNISDQFEVIASSPECQFDILKHKTLPYFGTQTHPEGSEDFYQNTIESKLSDSEKQRAFNDGLTLISNFLMGPSCP